MQDTSDAAFSPAHEPARFRRALGRYATGVAVVTARDAHGPIGVTANSFASVSLSPPLVLWSPAKTSKRHDAFVQAETFVIHVLGAGQLALCEHFTRTARGFENIAHDLGPSGLPLLKGCAAVFQCMRRAAHDAGDHTILVGEVIQAEHGEPSALVFRNGQLHCHHLEPADQ
jgi:flavin reductase (DIM6/NTAB) family NADH-FMN oxidoreductase RutF